MLLFSLQNLYFDQWSLQCVLDLLKIHHLGETEAVQQPLSPLTLGNPLLLDFQAWSFGLLTFCLIVFICPLTKLI